MIQTQSSPTDCYFDRNRLVQLVALKLKSDGKLVFYDKDTQTPGYIVLCIQLNEFTQLAWHIPIDELIIDLPYLEKQWVPTDITERKLHIDDLITTLNCLP